MWSMLIGLLLLVFAWHSTKYDDGYWLISIPIVFLLGDLLQGGANCADERMRRYLRP